MTKKKILVVCSRNKRRSLTAEHIFRSHESIEVRSAGTSPNARHTASVKDVEWADVILCMETKHKQQLKRIFPEAELPQIIVAEIEDEYQFMDLELVKILRDEILALV